MASLVVVKQLLILMLLTVGLIVLLFFGNSLINEAKVSQSFVSS